MSSLATIWKRLGEVVALQFHSESRSGIGWSGAGTGVVKVTSTTRATLIFDESGQWQQSGGKQIRFTNTFRWSQVDDQLRLEHLRFGVANPVFLFDMAPDESGGWCDVTPHLCRDDCYSATLEVDVSRLTLNWSVYGLKRDESIQSIYF